MVSRWVFLGFVVLLAAQRIFELRLSRKNEDWIRAHGGIEVGAGHFRVMQGLHALWFLAMVSELFWFGRNIQLPIAIPALIIFGVGQALRYSAILTLQRRWTVRVYILPGSRPVADGIYRWIRHPNYLGVILEMAAFPLIGNAYLTAILFSLANGALLTYRIRLEEKALAEYCGYNNAFKGRPRFFSLEFLKVRGRR